MTWLNLLVFLILCSGNFSLRCVRTNSVFNQSSIQISMGKVFRELKQVLRYEEVNSSDFCRVKIETDYGREVLTIQFTGQFPHQPLMDSQVRFVTELLSSDGKNFTIINSLESACFEEQCEREFLENHLPWLTQTDYQGLVPPVTSWMDSIKNPSSQLKYFHWSNTRNRALRFFHFRRMWCRNHEKLFESSMRIID